MQSKKSKVVYLGTIIGLFVFITVMFTINASFTQFQYILLGIAMYISLILLGLVFPKVWFQSILLIIGIVLLHLFSQSWMLTIALSIMALLFIYLVYDQRQNLGRIVFGVMTLVAIFGMIFLSDTHRTPTIGEELFLATMDEMKQHEEVTDVAVELEDETIYCVLEVDENLTDAEKRHLGEICAKTLAIKVSEHTNMKEPSNDYIGELYDYYDLELLIGTTNRSDDIIFTRKYMDNKNITW